MSPEFVILFCVLLGIGALAFTLVVRAKDVPQAVVENPELKHLENRRQVLYENLKDLQFEYHQGKLSDADYQSLKAGFLVDLAGIMASIEHTQSAPAPSASNAANKKKQKSHQAAATPAENRCPSCGGANPPFNRFCGQCGKPIPQ